ncbi:MAG TPA: hypothetical protein GXZ56_03570 [Bacteroidales bacterium]|jgi:hypothetical protein|nr:hypothetical protein [Bacteroidales bacterium]
MKGFLTSIALTVMIIFTGCTNLDEIYSEIDSLKKESKELIDRLNDHETQLKAIESLVETANLEIKTLRVLMDAVEKRVSVMSYKELDDKSGYELTLSDGTRINLKHAPVPVVGTKVHSDGLHYWTLNGEFMRDALGKMICTQGKDGIVPILRANIDRNWEVSLDGGTIWQEVKDATDNPVKAIGKEGESGTLGLSIIESDSTITIIYNGTAYVIPIRRHLNPLSCVAEYNMNPAGDGFVTDMTACDVSGFFSFYDAVARFRSITINGKRYHLPSKEEWGAIVPEIYNNLGFYVSFKITNAYDDVGESVMLQGESISFTSDFRSGVNDVCYALRYKGTDRVSAWRYEYIGNGNNTHMKITARSLHGQSGVTVEDIAQPGYWSVNNEIDVVRCFPASGERLTPSDGETLIYERVYGSFWALSVEDSTSAFNMVFVSNYYYWEEQSYASSSGQTYRTRGLNVRLFTSGD